MMAFLTIVDDDLDFAEAVAAALRGDGHETLVETDPTAVPGLLQQRLPDALILDVMFPESPTAGFELARTIRRTYEQLPILMLTAVNSQFPLGFSERDIDSTWLPVKEFLEKPVDFRVLREKIRQLLSANEVRPPAA
jgi:DNA-binding response OmpR family regulator